MKTYDENPDLTPEEKPNSGNEISKKDPAGCTGAENQLKKHFYDFETIYNNAKKMKVFELLGKPEYKTINEISDREIRKELERLLKIIKNSRVIVDFYCKYDDIAVYRFITEELFEEEVEDFQIEGMKFRFQFEEFHPNHDYEIRYLTQKFFELFLCKEWNVIHSGYQLSELIQHDTVKVKRDDFIKLILTFREKLKPVLIERIFFNIIKFDIGKQTGSSEGILSYAVENGKHITGRFKLGLFFSKYWVINKISFPGFNKYKKSDFKEGS
ncbi:MAG: hypothetical protein WAT71_11505 [Ignavibacteria bacterium]